MLCIHWWYIDGSSLIPVLAVSTGWLYVFKYVLYVYETYEYFAGNSKASCAAILKIKDGVSDLIRGLDICSDGKKHIDYILLSELGGLD